MKKQTGKIKVECLGRAASEVTQSIYQLTAGDRRIILDYGLYQSSDLVESYKVNHSVIKEISPKKIDFILISHANIDHCGALPVLYGRGCTAPIYVARGNKDLIRLMLYDSAKIMQSDVIKMTNEGYDKACPLYGSNEIERCLSFVFERDMDEEFSLCHGIMCEFTSAGHIVNSAQIRLTFNFDGLIKRIHYTGDIGSPYIGKYYVSPFEAPDKCDLLIGECTYSGENRNHSVRDREKDVEKIEAIIQNTCVENGGKVLIPVFALDRLQTLLTVLYDVFERCGFDVPVLVDTPLGESVCDVWGKIISRDKEKWHDVITWHRLNFAVDYTDSQSWQNSDKPAVILASSGMCNNGRSVSWVKTLLPGDNNHILFCGYSAVDTIATAIKDGQNNRFLKIDGVLTPNKCGVTILNSFSSHACRSELMEIYRKAQYSKLLLVHSDFDSKCVFAEELRGIIADDGRTSAVIVGNKGFSVNV